MPTQVKDENSRMLLKHQQCWHHKEEKEVIAIEEHMMVEVGVLNAHIVIEWAI